MKVTRINHGQEEENEIEIRIEAGWKADKRIVFSGAGNVMSNGQTQDVVFVIKEMNHKVFRRQGDDLFVTQTISLKDALSGYLFYCVGVDGEEIYYEINDVISPGDTRRIVGKGMSKEGGERGDIIIKFDVAFPAQLSQELKIYIAEHFPV